MAKRDDLGMVCPCVIALAIVCGIGCALLILALLSVFAGTYHYGHCATSHDVGVKCFQSKDSGEIGTCANLSYPSTLICPSGQLCDSQAFCQESMEMLQNVSECEQIKDGSCTNCQRRTCTGNKCFTNPCYRYLTTGRTYDWWAFIIMVLVATPLMFCPICIFFCIFRDSFLMCIVACCGRIIACRACATEKLRSCLSTSEEAEDSEDEESEDEESEEEDTPFRGNAPVLEVGMFVVAVEDMRITIAVDGRASQKIVRKGASGTVVRVQKTRQGPGYAIIDGDFEGALYIFTNCKKLKAMPHGYRAGDIVRATQQVIAGTGDVIAQKGDEATVVGPSTNQPGGQGPGARIQVKFKARRDGQTANVNALLKQISQPLE